VTEDLSLAVIAARAALGLCAPDPLLSEHGIPLPSVSQAAWTLLELHISDIASGILRPEEGMRVICAEVIRPAGMAHSMYKRPGESHDIGELLALEDEYDEIRRHELRAGSADQRRPGVDAQVLAEAREWLARNADRDGLHKLF
jgi:hypothetical protein